MCGGASLFSSRTESAEEFYSVQEALAARACIGGVR